MDGGTSRDVPDAGPKKLKKQTPMQGDVLFRDRNVWKGTFMLLIYFA